MTDWRTKKAKNEKRKHWVKIEKAQICWKNNFVVKLTHTHTHFNLQLNVCCVCVCVLHARCPMHMRATMLCLLSTTQNINNICLRARCWQNIAFYVFMTYSTMYHFCLLLLRLAGIIFSRGALAAYTLLATQFHSISKGIREYCKKCVPTQHYTPAKRNYCESSGEGAAKCYDVYESECRQSWTIVCVQLAISFVFDMSAMLFAPIHACVDDVGCGVSSNSASNVRCWTRNAFYSYCEKRHKSVPHAVEHNRWVESQWGVSRKCFTSFVFQRRNFTSNYFVFFFSAAINGWHSTVGFNRMHERCPVATAEVISLLC